MRLQNINAIYGLKNAVEYSELWAGMGAERYRTYAEDTVSVEMAAKALGEIGDSLALSSLERALKKKRVDKKIIQLAIEKIKEREAAKAKEQ